jgi:hypothetical protein
MHKYVVVKKICGLSLRKNFQVTQIPLEMVLVIPGRSSLITKEVINEET